MPYGAHETMEVHEILNEKINLINHFGVYRQQCQDPALEQMLHRHLQTAIDSYNQLVSYTHDYMRVPQYNEPNTMARNIRPQNVHYGLQNAQPQSPKMQGSFNDQQITSAMLSSHKNSAKNSLSAALECADPNVRQLLMNSSIICTNQAYEVFMYLNQKGMYQVPTMEADTARYYLHSYQPM